MKKNKKNIKKEERSNSPFEKGKKFEFENQDLEEFVSNDENIVINNQALEEVATPSIQSDLVDNHKSTFGVDISGLFFSSLTLVNKLAFGIASIVSFSLLDAYEFQTGQNANNEVKFILYFLYAGLPILLKLFACYLVSVCLFP